VNVALIVIAPTLSNLVIPSANDNTHVPFALVGVVNTLKSSLYFALNTKLDGIAANANNYSHPTGDGNLHVPATGTTNNRKFLMAGSTAGSLSWTTITASHITQDSNNRFITDAERTKWNSKAEGTHTHAEYRLISDSLSTTQTKAEINKLKTVVQSTQPTGQIAGAVWIETL
jgi:hypothetical protein